MAKKLFANCGTLKIFGHFWLKMRKRDTEEDGGEGGKKRDAQKRDADHSRLKRSLT